MGLPDAFAAERASEAFREFTRAMEKGIKDEKRRLRALDEELRLEAAALEEEYQAWRTAKIAEQKPSSDE